MGSATRPIIAIIAVAAAAIAFWTLALSPKRDEADKLGAQIETLNAGVQQAQSELAQATVAQRSFPAAYHQLVELGQAVPAGDETPSLLVELEALAASTGVKFESIALTGEGEIAPSTTPPSTESTEGSSTGVPAAEVIPPTEVEASLQPLGASIGSAGLDVMPYTLDFKGNFFQIAQFVGKVDGLVRTGSSRMTVDGRLVTINGFSLSPTTEEEGEGSTGGPTKLTASFSVTTYLTPPGQGVTAGASPAAPASESSTQTVSAR